MLRTTPILCNFLLPSTRDLVASVLVVTSCVGATAQVANNNFAQAPDTYTAIGGSGGPVTTLWSNNFDDQVSGPIALSPPFEFDGQVHTVMYVSSNGFITFGSAPGTTNYTPLSSTETYTGAIAPFGADLQSAANGLLGPLFPRDVRYRQDGNEVQIEWRGVRRKGQQEYFSFQIRLNTEFDGMRIVYGPILGPNSPAPADSELYFPEVGLRGPNNNHANNIKNRRVTINGNNNWVNSLPGNDATSVCRFTGGTDPRYWTTGQTYYFNGIWNCTIGVPCDDGDPCTSNDTTLDNCYCVGTYEDVDGDTVCDFYDLCFGPEPGLPCDDGDPCTVDGIVDGDCNCVSTALPDTDNDGVCDEQDGCPLDPNKIAPGDCGCGNPDPGQACDDGDPCTINDTVDSTCGCVGTFQDSDNDGVCDFLDVCPGPDPGQACDDGDPCTINDTVDSTCDCIGTYADSDNDGTCDFFDLCPGGLEPGTPCNDGNPNTVGDVIQANCTCAGTLASDCPPSPTGPAIHQVLVEINTDLGGQQITWSVQDPLDPSNVYCSGGPYLPAGVQINTNQLCTLPEGCYVFVLNDAGGDGMLNGFNGGYTLRSAADNRRIIDNRSNGDFGSTSRITGNCYSFCVPVGVDRLIHVSCDKYWWKSGEFVVANENPLVSAEWVVGGTNAMQPANSGYEFWFYAPNGGYSFRKLRSHNVADGAGSGALRACHLRVNNWAAAMHTPSGVLLNVKVRGRVQGINQPWGPACRFVRDEVLAQCPPTKLMDIPGNQFFSCDQFRQFVSNQRVHCRPVSGASQYQWRFRIPGEGVEIVRTSTTYYLNLGWNASVAAPLVAGNTYDVDVRAMKNGVWCGTSDPWGDICNLTISPTVGGGGVQSLLTDDAASVRLWPNPSTGDAVQLRVQGMDQDLMEFQVELYDLTGKRMLGRTLPLTDGAYEGPLPTEGGVASGLYLVRITAGDRSFTERLVLRP